MDDSIDFDHAITYHYIPSARMAQMHFQTGRPFPRRLHQIWVGPENPPIRWLQTCTALHPSWEVFLWNESMLTHMKHDSKWQPHGTIALQLSGSEGVSSKHVDLIRVELLYEYGGIVMDADMECLMPLDPLLDLGREFDYVSAWDHGFDRSSPFVATGVQMAHARSPTLLRALEYADRLNRFGGHGSWITTGPCWICLALVYPQWCDDEWKSRVLSRCGAPWIHGPQIPCAETKQPMKILPSDMFYPVRTEGVGGQRLPKHVFTDHHWKK